MSWLERRVARVPLRRRLVAGFVATMFVLLTGAAAFVYWRVQHALDRNLDTSLHRAATAIAPHVSSSGNLPVDDVSLATIDGLQVLDAHGRVLGHDGRLGEATALDQRAVREAAAAPIFRDTGTVFIDPDNDALRLYALPVHPTGATGGSAPAVLVLALDKNQRDEALRELVAQLTLTGLATLVLTAFVGDLLARAALRPVETYRRRATDIAAGATTLRLDVPAERDDEITRLGHTLNEMLDALTRALERERRFTNDASHELRTPIAIARGELELARPLASDSPAVAAALESAFEEVERLQVLAVNLLDLARTRAAGTPAETRVDLREVCAEAIENVRRASEPVHVEVSLRGEESLPFGKLLRLFRHDHILPRDCPSDHREGRRRLIPPLAHARGR